MLETKRAQQYFHITASVATLYINNCITHVKLRPSKHFLFFLGSFEKISVNVHHKDRLEL